MSSKKERKDTRILPEKKSIGYKRFLVEAALSIWRFKMWIAILLTLPVMILNQLIERISSATGSAITTANAGEFISFRMLIVIVLGILLIFFYVVFEIFAQVFLCEDILRNGSGKVFSEIRKGFQALRLFINPSGILIFFFILFAVPLCGVGFSISLTKDLFIPRFIMSVIHARPLYAIAYYAVVIVILVFVCRYLFVIHAVLIDQKNPREARAVSRNLIKKHWRELFRLLLKTVFVMALVTLAAYIAFRVLPEHMLIRAGEELPRNYHVDLEAGLSDLDKEVLGFRIGSAFYLFFGSYLYYVVQSLLTGNIMLQITRMYMKYTGREQTDYFRGITIKVGLLYVVRFVAFSLAVALLSVVIGMSFDFLAEAKTRVALTAHRTGGFLASENSLEGIDEAVRCGCYGSETDIQRTKDGHYVINHDTTFGRLTGVDQKPSEMTLAQIRELRIKDTTGNGDLLPVPTMEELLDRGKGRIKLFLELKGETADRQMVDDVVAAVKERDMIDDVILISLKYDVIDYAETTYPEFDTGVLIFSGFGDVSNLNCDMIIMEEEMSSDLRINSILEAGKQVGVWTVNTSEAMHHFLDSPASLIITDDIDRALKVQKELDDRSDYEVLRDMIVGF